MDALTPWHAWHGHEVASEVVAESRGDWIEDLMPYKARDTGT